MRFRLTHPQKRIWYVDKMYPDTSVHNIVGSMQINSEIDENKFEHAIKNVVAKNEGLRLAFGENNGVPYQYINHHDEYVIDYCQVICDKDNINAKLQSLAVEHFNIQSDRLFKVRLYKLFKGQYVLAISMHHIISDGWSINLFTKKIFDEYRGFNLNKKEESYLEYLRIEDSFMSSARYFKSKKYWLDKFDSVPEYNVKGSLNCKSLRVTKIIDSMKLNEIKKFTNEHRMSLNILFIIAKGIYDYKIEARNDIIYGVPVLNRGGSILKDIIGMFTSTVPIRFTIDGKLKIKDFIANVTKDFKLSLLNQRYPFDDLMDELKQRNKGLEGLFDTCVNYYVAQTPKLYDDQDVYSSEIFTGEQAYSLQIIVEEKKKSIHVSYDYKTDLYCSSEIESMHIAIMVIMEQLCKGLAEYINDIELVEQEEIDNKITLCSNMSGTTSNNTPIDVFERVVQSHSNKISVYQNDCEYSYNDLNNLANRYANFLISMNVKQGDVVGIQLSHSYDLVAIILGILKCGAIFLPIAQDNPVERSKYILLESDAKLLISENHEIICENQIDYKQINVSTYDNYFESISSPDELAYILYTSGSTGNPKGVMVTNSNLYNYASWAGQEYMSTSDIFAFYSSISFDLTITSIFAPLLSGNSIDVYDGKGSNFVLHDVINKDRITVIKMTPSHLTTVIDWIGKMSNLKTVILGGENLMVELTKGLKRKLPFVDIYNEYGPTEATVGCTVHKYDEMNDYSHTVPIGSPIDNTFVLLLNHDKNIVPDGIPGELYLCGHNVTKGYIKNTRLTDLSYMDLFGNRFYRTGDLCQYQKDGDLVFLSRMDKQVKVRGYRIELEEISNCIDQYEDVKSSIVVIDENNNICSYLVSDKKVDIDLLKVYLSKKIPNYMIPVLYCVVDRIPLTSNGKVAFDKLPSFTDTEERYIDDINDKERLILSEFKKILSIESLSLSDNFYEVGGDSIKAIQLSSRLSELGYELKIKDIMTSIDFYDTIKKVSLMETKIIANQNMVTGKQVTLPIHDWFFNENFINPNFYTQSILLEIDKSIVSEKLEGVLERVLNHHDALRLRFKRGDLIYHNSLLKSTLLSTYILKSQNSNSMKCEIEDLSMQLKKSISTNNSDLFKFGLFIGKDCNYLFLTIHHLIIDGVSWRILLNDISETLVDEDYLARIRKTTSYQEWASALRYSMKENTSSNIDWSFAEKYVNEIMIDVNDSVGVNERLIKTMCRNHFEDIAGDIFIEYKMKSHEMLIYILALTVSDLYEVNSFQIELEHHGRSFLSDQLDISRTIGWFTALYPLPITVHNDDNGVKEFKENLRYYEEHAREYLMFNRFSSSQPRIRFNYLGDVAFSQQFNKFCISDIDTGCDVDKSNKISALFEMNILLKDKELEIRFDFNTSSISTEEVTRFSRLYMENLRSIVENLSTKTNNSLSLSDFEDLDLSPEDFDVLFE